MCVHCRPPGAATPPVGVLDLMSALHRGDWACAEASPQSYRSQASGLVAAHLQWHLERQLRTLPLVELRIDARLPIGVQVVRQDVAHGGPGCEDDASPAAPGPRRLSDFPGQVHLAGSLPGSAAWTNGGTPGRRSTRRRRSPRRFRPTGTQSRRGRDGRQRPLGHPARAAPHRRPQDGRGGADRHRLRRHRNRRQAAVGLRVLHRELEAQPRGGPLPDGVQPRGGPPPPRESQRDGRAHAVGGFAAAHVAQRHQGIRDRRGDDRRTTTSSP